MVIKCMSSNIGSQLFWKIMKWGGKLVSDIFKSLQDQPNQEIEIEGFYDHNTVYQNFCQEYCQNKCIHKCMYPNHSRADFIPTYLHSERHGISHDLGFLPVPLDHTELWSEGQGRVVEEQLPEPVLPISRGRNRGNCARRTWNADVPQIQGNVPDTIHDYHHTQNGDS